MYTLSCTVLYRKLQPNNYTGLVLYEEKTNLDEERWEGEKVDIFHILV